MATVRRTSALDRLYAALDELQGRVGMRRLGDSRSTSGWPAKGVYLLFEDGEVRADGRPRVVRVGTHALTPSSRTTMWRRLRQHRGTIGGRAPGGGNHRSSILRGHVGQALIERDGLTGPGTRTWSVGSQAPREVRDRERSIERAVSQYVGGMWVLPIGVASRVQRGRLERDLIALLSNRDRPAIDPPSSRWLGRWAVRPHIRESGLWNVQHVDLPAQEVDIGWIVDRLQRAS